MSGEATAPVEVTVRYATTVEDLSAAWAFVMERIDEVGPDPTISITPSWRISASEMDVAEEREWPRVFEVVVSGMVHEGDRR